MAEAEAQSKRNSKKKERKDEIERSENVYPLLLSHLSEHYSLSRENDMAIDEPNNS